MFCLSQRAREWRLNIPKTHSLPPEHRFQEDIIYVLSLWHLCIRTAWFCKPAMFFSFSFWYQNKKPSGKVRDKEELHEHSAAFYILYVLTCPGLTDCLKRTIKAYLSLYLTFSTEGKLSPWYPIVKKKEKKESTVKAKACWLSNFQHTYDFLLSSPLEKPGLPSMPSLNRGAPAQSVWFI